MTSQKHNRTDWESYFWKWYPHLLWVDDNWTRVALWKTLNSFKPIHEQSFLILFKHQTDMISPLIKGWKVLKKICNNQIKNLVQEKKFRRMELMRITQRTMAKTLTQSSSSLPPKYCLPREMKNMFLVTIQYFMFLNFDQEPSFPSPFLLFWRCSLFLDLCPEMIPSSCFTLFLNSKHGVEKKLLRDKRQKFDKNTFYFTVLFHWHFYPYFPFVVRF